MKNKFLLLILVLLSLFVISGCKNEELYFNISNDTYNIYKGDIYKLEYDTNIKNVEWVSEDEEIASVKNGYISANETGLAVIDAMYKGVKYAEIYVFVEKRPFQIVLHTLTIDGDEYQVRDQSTILINLKEYFNGVTHLNYDDKSFVGWYLDEDYITPCDLNMEVISDMNIYSKYKSLEIISDLRVEIDNVVSDGGKFNKDVDVQTFSPAYGTYANCNTDYSNYTFVYVVYSPGDEAYYVTKIETEGNKENSVIPPAGFIICIKKSANDYLTYMNNLVVGAEISLGKYSVNASNVIYVNEKRDEFVNDFVLTTYLSCKYVSVYDVRNKTTLYSYDGDSITYPASTTKIITALAALKVAKLEDKLTIGDELDLCYEGSSPSTAGLIKGQVWTLRQLLYATLLPSGNDAAYGVAALAVNSKYPNNTYTAREKMDIFAEMMNEVARECGATNCKFMVPDGNSYYKSDGSWDDRMKYQNVTANDMCKIGTYALAFGAMAEVVGTASISFQLETKEYINLGTTNSLIKTTNQYYYEGCVGIKTGTTNPAGACLISAVEINRRLIVVAMLNNSTSTARYTNSIKVYDTIFK